VISPIVKDPEGDKSCTDNYCGLTLSHLFAFLFEHFCLLKFGTYFDTSNLQYGYIKKHSTSHTVYVLRTTVDYFCEHGSSVLVTFLDCSKGFDRVNHSGMFLKMMGRSAPLCLMRIIIYWYFNLASSCKWGGSVSDSFEVLSGVCQGGVLSSKIFSVYMDDLLLKLKESGVGCHIIVIFLAAILYADDVCLIAPTRSAMQTLLDICDRYAKY
jgi:hypothetical protein